MKTKIAILGDSSTQLLHRFLKEELQLNGLDTDTFEADFNQIERQVFDEGSELYEFNPSIIIVAYTAKKLQQKFYDLPGSDKSTYSAFLKDNFEQLYLRINSLLKSPKIIFFNIEEINDAVYGNFANSVRVSFINNIRRANVYLMDLAEKYKNLFILDVNNLSSQYGIKNNYHAGIYVNTEIVHTIEFTKEICKRCVDIINTLTGKFKKCVILDLDNTLWGGVIGDDGLENIELGNLGIGKVFVEFQKWLKQLKHRGIILAICSKNNVEIAKEVFISHPDCILKLEDIAVFIANWQNKADNIRNIQEILNISYDSMVFLDDNPAEREIVKINIPDITVPELPENPEDYLSFLTDLNLFETTTVSDNDEERTQQYRVEAERINFSTSFTDVNEFLRNLQMAARVNHFSDFDVPRITQLTQRSNQFNLRTVRYLESEIHEIKQSKDHATFSIDLKDKFGNHGLISVIILKKKNEEELFIDTWIMSCRVLKRTVENFTLNTLVDFAKDNNFKFLVGEYIPTPKNGLVKDHYQSLGFKKKDDDLWYLDIENYQSLTAHIQTNLTSWIEYKY